MQGELHVRFDKRGVETESGFWLLRHRQTKGPVTDRRNLRRRATSLLYRTLPLSLSKATACKAEFPGVRKLIADRQQRVEPGRFGEQFLSVLVG
jgi:hypothetical protein